MHHFGPPCIYDMLRHRHLFAKTCVCCSIIVAHSRKGNEFTWLSRLFITESLFVFFLHAGTSQHVNVTGALTWQNK